MSDADISEVPRPQSRVNYKPDPPKPRVIREVVSNYGWLNLDVDSYLYEGQEEVRFVVNLDGLHGPVLVDGTREGVIGRLNAVIHELEQLKPKIERHIHP